METSESSQLAVQQLAAPTALAENTALHVRLPPPSNPDLQGSLVRVIGQPDSPQLLFRSDALASLGMIPGSPGPEFFTTFVNLPLPELEQRLQNEQELASGQFGEVTDRFTLFKGRRPYGWGGGWLQGPGVLQPPPGFPQVQSRHP